MSGTGACSCGQRGTCDACRGIRDATPVAIENRGGLSTVRYRVGDHARFKESLLAGLSRAGAGARALRQLATRSDDDFSIALLDGFAVMADVLTFYQERIANESYLRTAKERFSLACLGKLIGYELRPGSAASVHLAFEMTEGAGAVERLPLPVGTRAQSTPGVGERPESFETVEEAELRPAWNAIPARTARTQKLGGDTREVLLRGGALNLRSGDAFLLVSRTGADDSVTAWSRCAASVVVDPAGQTTRVAFQSIDDGVVGSFPSATEAQVGLFVFRSRASLFGHNAPTLDVSKTPPVSAAWPVDPANDGTHLALDAVYREVVPGSWGVFECKAVAPHGVVLQVRAVREIGHAESGLTGKGSLIEIAPATANGNLAPPDFPALRSTTIALQSERLDLAEAPIEAPVRGAHIRFSRPVKGLEKGRRLAISGKRLVARVLAPVSFVASDGHAPIRLQPEDRLLLTGFPQDDGYGRASFTGVWKGVRGTVSAKPDEIVRAEEEATELAKIAEVDPDGAGVSLEAELSGTYDPASVRVNANVVAATHGESVKEEFDGGDGLQVFQRFPLKQLPLTHVSAETPSGVRSTLKVWVGDVEWHEVPSLYGRGPRDRVFVTRTDGDGRTWIQFGDGVTGSRLPTGARNVRAAYRRGIGSAANLKERQIDLLVSRPLGLNAVVNPLPSSDGKDPEVLEDARKNAPTTVLTLDRVVSLADFEDFARSFAAVAKALATWTWFGQTRGVFLTVAGAGGGPISSEGRRSLRDAILKFGDPHVPVQVENHGAATFRTGIRVKVDPDREWKLVIEAAERALRDAFSFALREFGQGVSLAEIAATVQRVPGVVAVQVTRLYRTGAVDPTAGLSAPVLARAPQPGDRGETNPAELLTLDGAPLDLLEAMQ